MKGKLQIYLYFKQREEIKERGPTFQRLDVAGFKIWSLL